MNTLAWYPMPRIAALGMVWVGIAGALALLVGAVIRFGDREEIQVEVPGADKPSDLDPAMVPRPDHLLSELMMLACLRAADGDPELADQIYPEFLRSEPSPEVAYHPDVEVWLAAVESDARRVRASLVP